MSLMGSVLPNQQSLSRYAHYYQQPQSCCAGCCRCLCHHRHSVTYTPPMTPPNPGSQPWAYQQTTTNGPQPRGANVVDFSDAPASMALMSGPD
jgi:hypothetical protein